MRGRTDIESREPERRKGTIGRGGRNRFGRGGEERGVSRARQRWREGSQTEGLCLFRRGGINRLEVVMSGEAGQRRREASRGR